VVQCWQCQSGKGFAGGIPLRATVTAFFTVPRSTSKKKAAAMDGTPHIKRPDADNVAKAILDALNGHAYNDDGAIAALTVWKYQTTGASRVEVTIEEAERWILKLKITLIAMKLKKFARMRCIKKSEKICAASM
jgi:Holliday junction resolvase RusA-like endonuclease